MKLASASPVERPKRLSAIADPMLSELYNLHVDACERQLVKPRRGGKLAKRLFDPGIDQNRTIYRACPHRPYISAAA